MARDKILLGFLVDSQISYHHCNLARGMSRKAAEKGKTYRDCDEEESVLGGLIQGGRSP